MRIILFLSSLACVILMGLHVWRENVDAEWLPHQRAYARALAARATSEADRAAARSFDVQMRQVVLPDGNATDRCVSCHVAVEDPRMAEASEPLRAHPGDYLNAHPVERFGCTLCHDGQGQALNFADAAAYRRERFWEKPMLPAPFLEANCYRCHTELLAETPTYARGREIFDGSGCIGCHAVRGRGANIGPDLSLVGDSSRHLKVPTPEHHNLVEQFGGNETIAYLYEAVRWPNAQPKDSKMPAFGFTDEEAIALVVYLKGLVRPATVVGLVPPPKPILPPTDIVERGRVAYARYCVGCHGESARGDIPNVNARNARIPPLNSLAGRMGFADPRVVDEFLGIVRTLNGAPLVGSAAEQLPNWPRIQEEMARARQAIARGLPVPALEAGGPEPLDMPAWSQILDDKQADAILAYLLTTMPESAPPASPSVRP